MFEWDEQKRKINLAKHKLDFVDACQIFDGRDVINLPARSDIEQRILTVGNIGKKFYTVIWTQRGDVCRIISFRRSRDEEEQKYKNLYS